MVTAWLRPRAPGNAKTNRFYPVNNICLTIASRPLKVGHQWCEGNHKGNRRPKKPKQPFKNMPSLSIQYVYYTFSGSHTRQPRAAGTSGFLPIPGLSGGTATLMSGTSFQASPAAPTEVV